MTADGRLITSNLFGLEAVVWNSGDVSLGVDRVRRPLVFNLDDEAEILATEVQETKNASMEEMQMTVVHTPKSVEIKWHQFDPGDAFKLFIIYQAKTQSSYNYNTRIVGTSLINTSTFKDVYPTRGEGWFASMAFDWENHRAALVFLVLSFIAQIGGMATLGIAIFGGRSLSEVVMSILMIGPSCV